MITIFKIFEDYRTLIDLNQTVPNFKSKFNIGDIVRFKTLKLDDISVDDVFFVKYIFKDEWYDLISVFSNKEVLSVDGNRIEKVTPEQESEIRLKIKTDKFNL